MKYTSLHVIDDELKDSKGDTMVDGSPDELGVKTLVKDARPVPVVEINGHLKGRGVFGVLE